MKNHKPIFIAGPCVIESQEILDQVAQEIIRLNKNLILILYLNLLLIKLIELQSIHTVDQE